MHIFVIDSSGKTCSLCWKFMNFKIILTGFSKRVGRNSLWGNVEGHWQGFHPSRNHGFIRKKRIALFWSPLPLPMKIEKILWHNYKAILLVSGAADWDGHASWSDARHGRLAHLHKDFDQQGGEELMDGMIIVEQKHPLKGCQKRWQTHMFIFS